MADRSTLITAAGFILRRMEQLTERTPASAGDLEEMRQEAAALRKKWHLVMEGLSGPHCKGTPPGRAPELPRPRGRN